MNQSPDASRHHEDSIEEAQLRWNDFVDAMGHELRTPLTAIIGFQELLEDGIYGEIGEGGLGAIRRIGSSAQELLALLNGMVDLARPAEAPPELDLGDVSVNSVFAEAAHIGRRLAPERDVAWSDEDTGDLGFIRTDARRLQRALFLLVLAAVRATPGGSLHLSAVPGDDGGAVVLLRGPAFARVPRPPLADIVLDRTEDDDERSLLRLCLAVDTLALLGCTVDLDTAEPPTVRIALRGRK